MALAGVTGCAAQAGTGGPTVGQRVVIVVSGTANEPRPVLSGQAENVVRTAANSTDTTDGPSGRGSVALVAAADGSSQRTLGLTPRRADGSVEHGLNRQQLIDGNVAGVTGVVASTRSTKPGLDLLAGLTGATRGGTPGTLIVLSSGLSTAGGFDLRQVGWQADPDTVARQLAGRDLLPKLAGWHVLFSGLGATAGAQPPLPNPQYDTLTDYWLAICRAAGAASCTADATRLPAAAPTATATEPVVPVPDVSSVVGPDGRTSTTVTDDALGFAGDSAALSTDARALLHGLAASIAARTDTGPVTVTGYAADPPGSTDRGRTALAQQRARAVAGELTADGVTGPLTVDGIGTVPGVTAVVGGTFDEQTAATMRRVVVTY